MALDLSIFQCFVLGPDPRLQLGLKRTLLASAIYIVCLLAQWISVIFGLADRGDALWLTAFCVSGLAFFVGSIRSGYSKRFDDAALTMPQMVFALLSLALAYRVNPVIRASLALVIPLVLIFGAFILPARRCVHLGWFAVGVFAITIAAAAWFAPSAFHPIIEAHTFGFIALVIPTVAYLAGQLSQLRIKQNEQRVELGVAMERLTRLATHDPLTDLPNRRDVDERMADVIVDVRRRRKPLCLAILDLDRFKRINDTFGHAAGDAVLRAFAEESSASLREGDLLARWGGEEFLLVMPATTLIEAQVILERLRERIALSASWAAYPYPRVTFSAGLAQLRDDQTLSQVLQCADFALYDAKSEGRDRIVVAAPDCGSISEAVAALPRRFRVDHPSTIF